MTRQRSVKKQQFNGRVSSYDPERFPAIAKDLAKHGATQEEIASTLGIRTSS